MDFVVFDKHRCIACLAFLAVLTQCVIWPGRGCCQEAKGPLIAYVGTFSAPLRDVLPTQVDLPPGNGRGIHIFQCRPCHRVDEAGWHP